MIKPATIDEIKSTFRTEEVIEDYVNLKRRGANLLGLCPFHNEKTPSFTVSPAKNLYKCFGCGKAGDGITFLMEHEHFTYPEALKYLAEKYNITIEEEERTDEQLAAQQHKDSLLLINQMAGDFFKSQLNDTDEGKNIGLSYFKHRGLLEHTIEKFGLGYSSRKSTALLEHATKGDYNIDLLKQLGLISSSDRDFFRERVIFPFFNLSGKVIGFGGRILKENVKAPKYLNSPETELYNKRKTLYGLYHAKGEIRKLNNTILVEGYTDVLSLSQNGIKNVVASSGTSLTPDQVGLIKRFSDQTTVLYDGDAAGQKAALRGLNIFLEYGMDVKVVTLPMGEDPDSYIQKVGTSEFEAFIKDEGKDFITMLAQNIQSEYADDPIQKSVQIKELINSLALISDQIKRQLYVQQCSRILQIEEGSLFAEINKVLRARIKKASFKRPENRNFNNAPDPSQAYVDFVPDQDHSQGIHEAKPLTDLDHQERDVIRVIISYSDRWYDEEEGITILNYILDQVEDSEEMITDPLLQELIADCKSIEGAASLAQEHWTHHSNPKIKESAMECLADPYIYANWEERGLLLQTQKPIEENHVKDTEQAILHFKLKKVKDLISKLQERFSTGSDDKKNIILITTYQKLLEQRRQLAAELNTIVM